MCISNSTCPRRRNTLRDVDETPRRRARHTRARSSPERTPRDSQLVRARAPVRSRRIGQSTGAREAPRARWRSARGDDASFHLSLACRGRAAFCVAALALLATGTATAAATDLSTPDDDCTNVDVFAIFPRHVDGQVVHARFDVRALDPSVVGPGSGRLGHVEGHSHPDHDVRVTTTLCLPRDQSFFLIASGNATRGSAFGRFTVTVASLEYHNMTIFSAGSEWTRGAEYDSDDPVGEGDGTFRFLEDQGVGPPLWDTPDSSRVYQLHERARFDTWRRDPFGASRPAGSRSAASSDCEALVAVVVGCTSYGNGRADGHGMGHLPRVRGRCGGVHARGEVRVGRQRGDHALSLRRIVRLRREGLWSGRTRLERRDVARRPRTHPGERDVLPRASARRVCGFADVVRSRRVCKIHV